MRIIPLDPNVIDYTKCLGSSSTEREKPTQAIIDRSIDYEQFSSIVGKDMIQKFEKKKKNNDAITQNSGNEEFFVLYQLWENVQKPRILASTGQLVDEGPGWGGKALVIRGGGPRIQILVTVADRMGETGSEGKISLAVCPRWS